MFAAPIAILLERSREAGFATCPAASRVVLPAPAARSATLNSRGNGRFYFAGCAGVVEADDACRIAGSDAVRGYVLHHYCVCCDNSVLTDLNPRADQTIDSQKGTLSDTNWCWRRQRGGKNRYIRIPMVVDVINDYNAHCDCRLIFN